MKKLNAKTPKVANKEITLSSEGKNSFAITGARKPYNAKSYHSNIMVRELAINVFLF